MSVRARVPIRACIEEEITIAGRKEKASALTVAEVETFVNQLEAIVHQTQSPIVKDIIARNARLILDVIRVVNVETKQGFKGMAARAGELEINYIRPRTLGKTTWLQTIAGTPPITVAWLSETTALEGEALVILGWIDPIEVPKIDAVLYTKDGDPLPVQTLPFEAKDAAIKTPAVEQKIPVVILPKHKIKIDLNAFATGDDKIQPIGFHIRASADFMALPGPVFGA